jgi:non-ribosomal peptide synthetase component F
VHFVPSMLREFLNHPLDGRCAGLRRVMCSGEALTAKDARRCLRAPAPRGAAQPVRTPGDR